MHTWVYVKFRWRFINSYVWKDGLEATVWFQVVHARLVAHFPFFKLSTTTHLIGTCWWTMNMKYSEVIRHDIVSLQEICTHWLGFLFLQTQEDGKESRVLEKTVFVLTSVAVMILTHGLAWAHWILPLIYAVSTPILVTVKTICYWLVHISTYKTSVLFLRTFQRPDVQSKGGIYNRSPLTTDTSISAPLLLYIHLHIIRNVWPNTATDPY